MALCLLAPRYRQPTTHALVALMPDRHKPSRLAVLAQDLRMVACSLVVLVCLLLSLHNLAALVRDLRKVCSLVVLVYRLPLLHSQVALARDLHKVCNLVVLECLLLPLHSLAVLAQDRRKLSSPVVPLHPHPHLA